MCVRFCADQVLAAVEQAISAIKAVVADPLTPSSSSSTPQASLDGSEGEAEGMVVATKTSRGSGTMTTPSLTKADAFPLAVAKTNEFSYIVEGWQSRVQPEAIKQFLGKVSVHGANV
jgi:hypothetical protein